VLETSHGANGPWTLLCPPVAPDQHQSPARARAQRYARSDTRATVMIRGWTRLMVRREGGKLVMVCEACSSHTVVKLPAKACALSAKMLESLLRWAEQQTSSLFPPPPIRPQLAMPAEDSEENESDRSDGSNEGDEGDEGEKAEMEELEANGKGKRCGKRRRTE
jgi:hypothetical protein